MRTEANGVTDVRHGDIIIDRDDDTGRGRAWFVFQRAEGTVEYYVGLVSLGPWQSIRTRYYRTVVVLDELVRYASSIGDDATRRPIMLSREPYGDVLWGPEDLDAFLEKDPEMMWMPLAKFSFGPPAENGTAPIRWIHLADFFPDPTPPLVVTSQVPSRPSDLHAIEDALFADIADQFKDVLRVRPHLDSDGASFNIRFLDKEGVEVSCYSTVLSEDARAVLRDPLNRGLPYSPGDGSHLTWDPYSDITYGEMRNTQIPLRFFEPYVVRSGEFFGLPLPETASDVASMRVGETVAIIIHHDQSRCPMRGNIHDACWRIKFDGLVGPRVREVEQQPLLSHMVVTLVDAPFLVDIDNALLHPTIATFELDNKDLRPPKSFLRNETLRQALVRAGIKNVPPPPQTFEEGWQPEEDVEDDAGSDEGWQPDEEPEPEEGIDDLDSIWSDEGRQPDDW